ncbi:pheromone A receptor-domain-containing protein [Crassisporium funariophilum]|nr:pheromone A receptor-domain-containing protein [Crassisporium funariophilum]
MPFPATYPNYVFSIFAFIGFLFCSIPFPWHLEAWNTGTCLYMAWTGLACLNQFINSIVWNRNAINWAPVWCDISSKFIVGTAVAIPAASLCINRRLYHIASVRSVTITKAEKRRGIMVDLAIGLGLPILEMILQYIPQGHRFNIFEDVGCYPFTYDTWVAYVLVSLPPILVGLVSAVYAILSIIAFNKSRSQFNEFLSGHKNLTSSRYFRLMCLAGIEVICTVPLGCYAVYLNAADHGIRPWKGWADTHAGFSRVDQIPAILWRSNEITEISLELTRWLAPICAVVFFGFFGFAEEAKKNYRSAIQSVAKRVGISTGSFGNSSGMFTSSGSKSNGFKSKAVGSTGKVRPIMPVFVHREMLQRHDSMDSFSNMSLEIADVGGALNEKKDAEKEQAFSPILSYGAITLSDVGGTLADFNDGPYSPAPSSGSSSASSVSSPSLALTRQNSDSNIEISSVRRGSMSSPSSPNTLAVPLPTHPSPTAQKSHTHDIV